MNDRENSHRANFLDGREPAMNYQYQSREDVVFDPELERLFDLANAAADRTAPSVNIHALIADAFASIDAKPRARDLAESSKTAAKEEATSFSTHLARQEFERLSWLRSQLMRLIKHARLNFSHASTTLVLCTRYILVLMISIRYGQPLFLFLVGVMVLLDVGVLIGSSLHTRSIDRQYRCLNERETALDARGISRYDLR